jgi:hypothetical protein
LVLEYINAICEFILSLNWNLNHPRKVEYKIVRSSPWTTLIASSAAHSRTKCNTAPAMVDSGGVFSFATKGCMVGTHVTSIARLHALQHTVLSTSEARNSTRQWLSPRQSRRYFLWHSAACNLLQEKGTNPWASSLGLRPSWFEFSWSPAPRSVAIPSRSEASLS